MELRHLRYFTGVVEWKGYREASRRLHVAQAALSHTVTDLEEELGVELFVRDGRNIRLTSEGEIFHAEAIKILKQSESAIELVKRASRGEVGVLNIGFCGAATYGFMPDLVRKFKALHPGVKVTLSDMSPVAQEAGFAEESIDIGFNRPLSADVRDLFESRLLFKEPMVLAVPNTHRIKTTRVKLEDIATESFILISRKISPAVYDSIVRAFNERELCPRIEMEPDALHTALALVAADQGVAIVPACARSLHFSGVRFVQLSSGVPKADLVLVWKKAASSPIVQSFVGLTMNNVSEIRKKATLS